VCQLHAEVRFFYFGHCRDASRTDLHVCILQVGLAESGIMIDTEDPGLVKIRACGHQQQTFPVSSSIDPLAELLSSFSSHGSPRRWKNQPPWKMKYRWMCSSCEASLTKTRRRPLRKAQNLDPKTEDVRTFRLNGLFEIVSCHLKERDDGYGWHFPGLLCIYTVVDMCSR
jgi:hypothetical protein